MISQSAEYALRAMVVLLSREGITFCSAQDIAAHAKVPADYMSKILNALVRSGLVVAQRGRHGGCKASRPATEISVYDIVQAVDPIPRIHSCPLGIASHGTNLCALHRKLDDAARHVEEAFRSTTMAELLGETTMSKPLCEQVNIHHVEGAIH
jgi:Rrf2 family protein